MVTVQRENLCCICVCDSVPTRLGEDHGDLETAVGSQRLGKIGPVNNVTVQLSVCTLREADMSASGTDRAVRKPKRYSSDTPLLKRLIPSKVPGFCI